VKVVGALGVNISVGESRELILLIGESNRIVLVTYSVFVCDEEDMCGQSPSYWNRTSCYSFLCCMSSYFSTFIT
jgi:hypothetical protein